MKNKKAFTLIEMVLSISIIVILGSIVTVNITRYIDGANVAGAAAESHADKYDTAHSEVNELGNVAGIASPTASPTPASPTTSPTPASPTASPTPASPTASPTPASPTASPTPASPTASPTPAVGYPGTTMSVKPITWNGAYNYEVDFGIPEHTITQKVTFSLPVGTTVKLGWGASSFKSTQNGGKIIFTIDAYQSNIGVYFSYTGAEVFNPIITDIS